MVFSKQSNNQTVKTTNRQTDKPSNSQTDKLSKKDARKARAEERAALAPKVKELKKRISTAERKLEELQQALDETSAELFNPKPDTDFAEANRKVRAIQAEIDRYTADWEEASLELEELS